MVGAMPVAGRAVFLFLKSSGLAQRVVGQPRSCKQPTRRRHDNALSPGPCLSRKDLLVVNPPALSMSGMGRTVIAIATHGRTGQKV